MHSRLLALLLVVASCGPAACGRTELDLIPDDGGTSTGAGGSSAGGRGGGAGRGGASGTTGAGGQGPIRLMCGQDICASGTEICCFQANTQTCIPATQQCSGASIGCLDGAACAGVRFCCLSLLGGSTSCQPAPLCGLQGGLFLCASDGQCPATASHCCRVGDTGVCSAQPCP